ncbi:protein bassoon-like [Lathamus discolor]|uniref:protein bassoon-like n=1 Tax=Lathamus discolor TaxID=678569 RepID=UPI0032B7928C
MDCSASARRRRRRRSGQRPGAATAGTMGQPTEGRQELPSQHSPKPRLHTAGAAVCFSSQAPASKTGTSESLLHPHGQLPQREPFPWPLGSSSAQPALPKPDHREGEPAKGPASASVPRKRDVSLQTNLTTTQGRREASPVDESQPTASAATVISRLVLSKEVHSKLEAHIARKCLEMEQRQPPAAARDSTATHRSLPKRLWDGARGGDPCLKPRCQTAQVRAPAAGGDPGAALPCPEAAALPGPARHRAAMGAVGAREGARWGRAAGQQPAPRTHRSPPSTQHLHEPWQERTQLP